VTYVQDSRPRVLWGGCLSQRSFLEAVRDVLGPGLAIETALYSRLSIEEAQRPVYAVGRHSEHLLIGSY
jgi:hypothetical protein